MFHLISQSISLQNRVEWNVASIKQCWVFCFPQLTLHTCLWIVQYFFIMNFDVHTNRRIKLSVMAAIAVRKKVVSIGHFPPSFCLQSLQIFLFVRLNQEQLYVLIALKIREKKDWAKWARWAKILKITHTDDQLCSLAFLLLLQASQTPAT